MVSGAPREGWCRRPRGRSSASFCPLAQKLFSSLSSRPPLRSCMPLHTTASNAASHHCLTHREVIPHLVLHAPVLQVPAAVRLPQKAPHLTQVACVREGERPRAVTQVDATSRIRVDLPHCFVAACVLFRALGLQRVARQLLSYILHLLSRCVE